MKLFSLPFAILGSLWLSTCVSADPVSWKEDLHEFTSRHAAQIQENLASLGKSWGHHHLFQESRKLRSDDPRACSETIGFLSIAETTAIAEVFLETLLMGDLAAYLDSAKTVLLGSVQYDIQVIKVCQSCQEAESLDEDFLNDDGNDYGAYRSYCGEDIYGYDARHSGLLFLPIDPATELPVMGKPRGSVMMHGARLGVEEAPTELWPRNFTEVLAPDSITTALLAFADYIVCLLGTSSGVISVAPDYLGYGETQATHNRVSTIHVRQYSMKAWGSSYLLSFL